MQILFAIAVLSCSALIWAAISITKHIQRTNRRSRSAHHAPETFVSYAQAGRPQQGPHPREDFASGLASRLSQEQFSPLSTRRPPVSVRPDLNNRKANGTNGFAR
ncbi:hypothetical protein AciPR4_2023 [Terriglobus saanensis SP1PR4]|uniref:Uncharacterized protein n=1 Tax=Terriglobus saanensis (strain ATCC BAA-1853 / DSM 23119 / SP1PR4) TaxID=401053 RepID=E8V7B4_TERSS|nr:hypothetical protein AciPR4_2023 [Terriglobus saanensis SP1PR4]